MGSQEQALDGDDSQWRGTTADERAQERRVRLLAAAFEVLASEGGAGVTVRAVVRTSGLSPRFFYESFADRDTLLIAVWEEQYAQVVAHVEAAIAEAEPGLAARLRAALVATAHWLEERPSRAAVMLRETLAEPLLREHAQRRLPELVLLTMALSVEPEVLAEVPETAVEIAVVALSGAILNLFLEWSAGRLAVSAEELAEAIVVVTETSMAHLPAR